MVLVSGHRNIQNIDTTHLVMFKHSTTDSNQLKQKSFE